MDTTSSRVQTILVSLLFLLLFPYESLAPIYGYFPGLSKLLEGADVVVVADILEKSTTTYVGGDVFKIRGERFPAYKTAVTSRLASP